MTEKRGRGRPPGKTAPKTKGICTRLEFPDIKKLQRAARGDGRSVSNYLAMLIKEHLNNLDPDELSPRY